MGDGARRMWEVRDRTLVRSPGAGGYVAAGSLAGEAGRPCGDGGRELGRDDTEDVRPGRPGDAVAGRFRRGTPLSPSRSAFARTGPPVLAGQLTFRPLKSNTLPAGPECCHSTHAAARNALRSSMVRFRGSLINLPINCGGPHRPIYFAKSKAAKLCLMKAYEGEATLATWCQVSGIAGASTRWARSRTPDLVAIKGLQVCCRMGFCLT